MDAANRRQDCNKVVENTVMATRKSIRRKTLAEPLSGVGLSADGDPDDIRRRDHGALDAMLAKIADFTTTEWTTPSMP
jgi:hypothetical protein